MENGNDLNLILSNIKKDSKRISVYDGIQVWITNDLCQSFVDTVHELKVQVFALMSLSGKGVSLDCGGVAPLWPISRYHCLKS